MSLKNKTVLITGASQGLGAVLAKKIAEEKATVILLARSEEKLQTIQTDIQNAGGKAEIFICDIRKDNTIQQALSQITAKHKTIDVLINNAGIWTDDELEKANPTRRLTTFETNVIGQIHLTETLLPEFKKQNKGIIFNVISTAGVPEIPAGDNRFWKTYGASKWAFTGYTHALRESLRDTKIKVIQYFPGGFESNLYENAERPNAHDQPWMMKTEDVADIVLFTITRPDDVYMEKIVVSKMM